MSLRSRPANSAAISAVAATDDEPETPKSQPQPTSLAQRALSQTLASTADLANLLPTGTLLAFQLLTPVFTNNGSCDAVTRPITLFLLTLLALSCFLACFTDSVKTSDGKVYHGFATFNGMWVIDSDEGTILPDLSRYRLRFIDFVHGVLSVFVFAAVALRDQNVVKCLYPMPAHETQEVLDIVPLGMGFFSAMLFMMFPTKRHGIGYPVTPGS